MVKWMAKPLYKAILSDWRGARMIPLASKSVFKDSSLNYLLFRTD